MRNVGVFRVVLGFILLFKIFVKYCGIISGWEGLLYVRVNIGIRLVWNGILFILFFIVFDF